MKAIRKRPGEGPELIDIRDDDHIREELGGYMEAVTLTEDLVILCDEEGRLKGKAPNCVICGVDFVGTILVLGVRGEEFADVPDADGVLLYLFGTVRYARADRAHNVWSCRNCGHIERFEADGPFENGWNICPVCGGWILRPSGE